MLIVSAVEGVLKDERNEALHALLKRERLPMFNLGYADVAGNTFALRWNTLSGSYFVFSSRSRA